MSRGQPDFGMYAVKEVTASISDMGEVAARLGSIVTYDKRGDVVDFDNFEGPVLRWQGETPTGDTYARLDSYSVKSGSQAVKLHTKAGSEEDCQIWKSSSILASKRLGHEISFGPLSTACYFHVFIIHYDGTHRFEGEARIDKNALELQLLTASGVYTRIADIASLGTTPFVFFTIKVVVDFDTNKYIRLLFAQNSYDISAHSLIQSDSGTGPRITIGTWIQNRNSTGGDVWVDDSILTQAEP